jgi:hypothetical protein
LASEEPTNHPKVRQFVFECSLGSAGERLGYYYKLLCAPQWAIAMGHGHGHNWHDNGQWASMFDAMMDCNAQCAWHCAWLMDGGCGWWLAADLGPRSEVGGRRGRQKTSRRPLCGTRHTDSLCICCICDLPVQPIPRPTYSSGFFLVRFFSVSRQGEFKNTAKFVLQKVHVENLLQKNRHRQIFMSVFPQFFVPSHFGVFLGDGGFRKHEKKTFYQNKYVKKKLHKKIDKKI